MLLALVACSPDTLPGSPTVPKDETPSSPSTSDTVPTTTLPTGDPLDPDDPGPADLSVEVDTQSDVHPISPWIYGDNGADFDAWGAHLTLGRSGGNRLTAYNWENNASNAGTDWFNQNDDLLGGGDVAGEAVRPSVQAARDHGAGYVVTVPIQGYVAADKDGGGDVAYTPDYLNVRFDESVSTKGSAFQYPPDVTDGVVYQDEFVSWLLGEFPGATDGSGPPILFSLDNEPDLWASTHPRIHPDPAGYGELVADTVDYAAAIKAVDPDATVIGPVSYGWYGYLTLQDAPDGAGRDFLDFWLDSMRQAEADAGQRLVDAMDLHWYPEATDASGTRITDDAAWDSVADARVQAPRSLWDDTYTENSWITQWSTYGPIALLPRMQDKIAAHDPGTELSLTEYYYGGGADISGGLAEADVLGIFGAFDLFAATLWHLGSTDDAYIHAAYDLYRNYDGDGAAFGSNSVSATTSDRETSSAWASAEGDLVYVVVINKDRASHTVGLRIWNPVRLTTATPYVLGPADAAVVPGAPISLTLTNALALDLPAQTAELLVLSP